MRSPWSAKILLFACAAVLMACSGSGAPNSAVGGGGAVGGNGDTTFTGGGGAAQPMDSGFAGGGKDVAGYKYLARDASATVLCKEAPDFVQVRFQGFLQSESPSGVIEDKAGLVKVSDFNADHYQVTQASADPGQLGYFKTTLKVQKDLNVHLSFIPDHAGPMETLLPKTEGFVIGYPAEPRPELKVEQGPRADKECLTTVPDYTAEIVED